jgi:hypothetical protein
MLLRGCLVGRAELVVQCRDGYEFPLYWDGIGMGVTL